MSKTGVFIYGSCVSRDTFEHLDPTEFELIRYVARQSALSAYTAPVTLVKPPELRSAFQQRMVSGDFESNLRAQLVAAGAAVDLLLIDLTDERLGVYVLPDGTVLTRSIELIESGREQQLPAGTRHLVFGSDEHFRYWSDAIAAVNGFIADAMPRAAVAILDIPWADRTDTGIPSPDSFGVTAAEANLLYRRYVDVAVSTLGARRIAPGGVTASKRHPWGLAPFHYSERVYRDAVEALTGAPGRTVWPTRDPVPEQIREHMHSESANQPPVSETRRGGRIAEESMSAPAHSNQSPGARMPQSGRHQIAGVSDQVRASTTATAGYIEDLSADRRRVTGWVRLDDDSTPGLRATLYEISFGDVTIGLPRDDVTSRLGVPNRRFLIDLPHPLPPGAILAGDFAVAHDNHKLEPVATLISQDRQTLAAWAHGELLTAISEPRLGQGSHGLAAPVPATASSGVSRVPVPVGTQCKDGSAVIGANGHLFLRGGSNDLASRYRKPASPAEEAALEGEVERWSELLLSRAATCGTLGVGYLQTIVPEKSTAVLSGIPELSGMTPTLARLEALHADTPWYVSAHQVLAGPEPGDLWQRLDTHLSPRGSAALSQALVAVICPSYTWPKLSWDRRESLVGDLTARFFGVGVPEIVPAPSSVEMDTYGRSAELVERVDPTGGNKFVGMRRVWRNEQAPIGTRVAVFGNSFFGSDPWSSGRCNYWFLRLFRELHFLWSPGVDYGYVLDRNIDVVVAQTNERFLSVIPTDVPSEW